MLSFREALFDVTFCLLLQVPIEKIEIEATRFLTSLGNVYKLKEIKEKL